MVSLVVCAGVGCAVHALWGSSGRGETSAHKVGIDDAFITYRYAQNLVTGHGLVFNPGERVGGFTNPAWVGLASIFYALFGADALHGGVVATTTIFLLAGLPFLWRVGRRNLAPPTLLATLAGLALCPYVGPSPAPGSRRSRSHSASCSSGFLFWTWSDVQISKPRDATPFLLFLYPVAAACVGHGLSLSPPSSILRRLLMMWMALLLAIPIVIALRSDSRFRYSTDR